MPLTPTHAYSRGLFFEQFEVGLALATPARTLGEADVTLFAGLSGDFNPLHTDAEFAQSCGFGQRVAHGMLGLSVATGLAARAGFLDGTALAFLSVDWKFRRPILFGDTIAADVTVTRAKAMPAMGGGIVTFDVRVRNQRGEVVQKGLWEILVKSAEGPGIRPS
jgi:3-hydroxybutyryl-CoA dehydratase